MESLSNIYKTQAWVVQKRKCTVTVNGNGMGWPIDDRPMCHYQNCGHTYEDRQKVQFQNHVYNWNRSGTQNIHIFAFVPAIIGTEVVPKEETKE